MSLGQNMNPCNGTKKAQHRLGSSRSRNRLERVYLRFTDYKENSVNITGQYYATLLEKLKDATLNMKIKIGDLFLTSMTSLKFRGLVVEVGLGLAWLDLVRQFKLSFYKET